MNRPRLGVVIRWTIGGIIALAGARALFLAMTHEASMGGVVLKILTGVVLVITASLFVAPEIVHLVVAPINYVLDAILLPSESLRPPVDYKLARFYSAQMRYEDACEEYLKILYYHPQEMDAYVEGIEAATAAGRRNTALKFYRMAMRKLSARDGDRQRFVQRVTDGPVTEPAAELAERENDVPPP